MKTAFAGFTAAGLAASGIFAGDSPARSFFFSSKKANTPTPELALRTKTFIWGNSTYLVRPDPTLRFKNLEPKHIKTFQGEDKPNLTLIKFGETHEAGIDNHGHLLVWKKMIIDDSNPKDSDNLREGVIDLDPKKSGYKEIGFTRGFLWALNEKGEVFSWKIARNSDDEKGSESIEADSKRQIKSLPQGIRQIACGFDHVLTLNSSGEVFAMGDDTFGQCGQGTLSRKQHPPFYERRVKNPRKVEGLPSKVLRIACGLNHSLAVNEKGELFGWGYNSNLQLSQEEEFADRENPLIGIFAPRSITKNLENHTVTDVAAGEEHTVIVTEHKVSGETEVFSCGHNKKGELGTGTLRQVADIQKIPGLSNFTVIDENGETQQVRVNRINCGNHHTIALLSPGLVIEWGQNDYGQMGNKRRSHMQDPTIVTTFKKQQVFDVAAGSNSNAVICIDKNATVAETAQPQGK